MKIVIIGGTGLTGIMRRRTNRWTRAAEARFAS
jgi:hypothetical protein